MKGKSVRFTLLLVLALLIVSGCSSPEKKKQSFYEKGKTLYELKDYTKSRLALKNAIQIDPMFAGAYQLLGEVEMADMELEKAFRYFSKAVELDAGLLDAHAAMGKIFLVARQIEKARAKCDYVLEKAPEHHKARLLETGVLLAENKPEPARSRLEKLLARGATDFEAYIMLGAILNSAGDSAGAMETLRRGISANPDNIRLRGVLTRLLTKEKKFEEAIKLVKASMAIEPENKVHVRTLASLYWKADRRRDVEVLFQNVAAKDENPEDIHIMASAFYAGQKQMDKALAQINTGIDAAPESIKLHLALSALQMAERAYDQALGTLQTALALRQDDTDPEVIDVKNRMARIYLGKGEIDKAKQYADEVIAVSGGNVDAQYTAGRIYLRKKDGLNAVSAFRTVVAENPDIEAGHLKLAQAHLVNNEKQLALAALANGLSSNPNAIRLRQAMARIHVADKNHAGAEKELRLIVQQNPEDLRAQVELAQFLVGRERIDEAVDICLKMVEAHPKVPAGYLKLAEIYRIRNKDKKAATAILEKGYETEPNSMALLSALMKVYASSDNHGKAIDLLNKRLESNAGDVMAHNMIGEIYFLQKQLVRSEQAFQKAIAIRPEWQIPHNNLARLYLHQNKTDAAIHSLTASINVNPENPAAYMTLGYLYRISGQAEKAIGIYEKALKEIPDLWPAANNLAYVLAARNAEPDDLDRAKEMALQAVRIKPELASVIDTLGWVHYLRGEYDLAIAELEKAVKRTPDSATINYHLAMALKKVNRFDEAREHLDRALEGEDFPERTDAKKALEALKAV